MSHEAYQRLASLLAELCGELTKPQRQALRKSLEECSARIPESDGERLAALRRDVAQQHRDRNYTPQQAVLMVHPLRLKLLPERACTPKLNVVLPSLCMRHLSGGPNTALNLAYRLAGCGVAVRIVAACQALDDDLEPLWQHLQHLSGIPRKLELVQIIDASDRTGQAPFLMGRNDIFLATAWWTAQLVKYAVKQTVPGAFIYLIQDYEPLLHPASTTYAMCLETYAKDYFPVINSHLLAEYFTANKVGRFEDPVFAATATPFEPAVDCALFHPEPPLPGRPKRLLFYARPCCGLRNLFEMGVEALKLAAGRGVFSGQDWEIIGMGDQFEPVDLGQGTTLAPSPWCNLHDYAARMRQSDVMLSLMLSPHPSYPPLEMAACGGVSVTTSFGNKTAAALRRLSPRILAVEPSIENLAQAIEDAVALAVRPGERSGSLCMPATWERSFAPALARINEFLRVMRGLPAVRKAWRRPDDDARYPWGFAKWPVNTEGFMRQERFKRRQNLYPRVSAPNMFSLLTSVYDTAPEYLEYLARSVFEQDFGPDGDENFEWVILDNGSTRQDTRDFLESIRRHPRVRFSRVEENLGIVGGMRHCLLRARNRYIIPVDSDDYLSPDCLRVAAWHIVRNGYPPYLYSDEDHLKGDEFVHPFHKPDWDPVFFIYSCYIAHMCVMELATAMRLRLYDDPALEGCHDWDSFTRAHLAGITPVHIPEILYTWRIHEHSCAGNAAAKPYVFASHKKLLEKFLAGQRRPDLYSIETSPFPQMKMLDHWLKRLDRELPRVTTVVLAEGEPDLTQYVLPASAEHTILALSPCHGLAGLVPIAEQCAQSGSLVHLTAPDVRIAYAEWLFEVVALFEFFPDTVMIGGRIHADGKIKDASQYFGFGRGCDSPDAGEDANDLGFLYRVLRQHSVSAVPWRHSVIKPEFLLTALRAILSHSDSFAMLGAWLGAQAMQCGARVVYTPYLSACAAEDWREEAPDDKLARWTVVNGHLLPDTRYYPRHLGLTMESRFRSILPAQRAAERRAQAHIPYAQWLELRQEERQARYPKRGQGPKFSILTTLYAGTSPEWFPKTVESILGQDYPCFEWVLVADADLAPDLQAELESLCRDAHVRLHRLDTNLGIIPKMRYGLGICSGDYVLPMDADDLLTPDALRILVTHILKETRDDRSPAFVYSDEDNYKDDTPISPIFRPAPDPILYLDASLVFHPCAYRRDLGLELDLYTDAGTAWCHDWDTVTRFITAGYELLHVPEVLYHWRQHEQSFSNNAGQVQTGTIASVRHMLTRRIEELGRLGGADRYGIGPKGLQLGGLNIGLCRKPVDAPPICLVSLFDEPGQARRHGFTPGTFTSFPFAGTLAVARRDGAAENAGELLRQLVDGPGEFVLFAHGTLALDNEQGIWEAVRLFELHPEVAVVGGRILDADGHVAVSAGFFDPWGELLFPYSGRHHDDDGPLALAGRSQEAALAPSELFLARRELLRQALEWGGIPLPGAHALGAVLSAAAWDLGHVVAYAPLLQARFLLARPPAAWGGEGEWGGLGGLGAGNLCLDLPRIITRVLCGAWQGAAPYQYYRNRFGSL